ncbi:MAG: hypothetical protein KKB51_05400 [Candidatus Riflebacteria bacterium]|nr:hypothetical protein [Candidatus Riflebacteria bacterium]
MSSIKYKCVLVCEDIRQEVGGRVSLMGVLGSKLLVQSFPLPFPKLCLFIEWGEIAGKVNVTLNIIPPDGVEIPKVRPSAPIQGQPGLVARSMIVLSNFSFPAAGKYVFEFEADGKVVGRENFLVEKYEGPISAPN